MLHTGFWLGIQLQNVLRTGTAKRLNTRFIFGEARWREVVTAHVLEVYQRAFNCQDRKTPPQLLIFLKRRRLEVPELPVPGFKFNSKVEQNFVKNLVFCYDSEALLFRVFVLVA
jgi:hypothetical protein